YGARYSPHDNPVERIWAALKAFIANTAVTWPARIQADVLSQLAELQERDDPEAALDVLERIIVLNPDPEETWRRIIRLQLRLNRRDQARNTAALLRKRLQELGVRPIRETERLFSKL
ncbi:bacterial transcriptional activator domain-containing protein, partial [Streptosporangium sp. NPDC020145]|uniref:bacterial transcriptional activator domain-containing protein n=1 Tax=Streptosporangium sp. NPDC020145 TaxID=3154694 RepID=UPI0034441874